MEPQNVEQKIVEPEEANKVQAEKAPVVVNWKKPIISIIIIGVLALGLMLLARYL